MQRPRASRASGMWDCNFVAFKYPRDAIAAETAQEELNSDSIIREVSAPSSPVIPLQSNEFQSIPRAISPKLKFLISSKTMAVKRKDISIEKAISSVGTLTNDKGRRYHRTPLAISSGVVVQRIKNVDCKVVNVRHYAPIARSTLFRVICIGP